MGTKDSPTDVRPVSIKPCDMEVEETDAILAPSLERGRALVYSAEEWLSLKFEKCDAVVGTPKQAIVRPYTKNIVEAPEKSYKTSWLLRLLLGLSVGQTVFPTLPVRRPYRVLYLHGELSPPELKDRISSAIVGLPRPLDNFFQGRDLRLNLIEPSGKQALSRLIQDYKPEVLALDAWQSFITGYDENLFKDVSQAVHFLDTLIENHGLTFFMAIHQGKDRQRGARGHSLLAGWRDTRFRLERSNGLVTVYTDPRWAAPVPPFRLEFAQGTLWPTDELPQQAQWLAKLVKKAGGECSRKELQRKTEMTPAAFRKALQRAKDAGALVVKGDTVIVAGCDRDGVTPL